MDLDLLIEAQKRWTNHLVFLKTLLSEDGSATKLKRPRGAATTHGSMVRYNQGCSCAMCKEANRARVRKYMRNRPKEEQRAWAARMNAARRARKLGVEHESWDRRDVFVQSQGMCGLCDGPLDPENFHVDHIVRLRDGGADIPDNLQATHPACNLRKH